MDLAIIEAFMALVFALLYRFAGDEIVREAAKYLFLVVMMVCLLQLQGEFPTATYLQYLALFGIVIFFIIMLLDILKYIPFLSLKIRNMFRR